MLISLVVDFDPGTAEMASGAIWHPHRVLSALCNITCLGRWLEIEIELRGLIRLGLRVHDRRFDRAVHEQADAVNPRLQTLRNITALRIGLDRIEELLPIPGLNSNVCASYWLAFCIFDDPLNGCWSSPSARSAQKQPHKPNLQ